MAGTVAGRRYIANDTIARTPAIIMSTLGASADATFYKDADSCPALDRSSRLQPLHGPSRVTVINTDTFTAARAIIRRDPAAARKVAVLNLASDECPGGGWIVTLSRTQVFLSLKTHCVPVILTEIFIRRKPFVIPPHCIRPCDPSGTRGQI